MSLHRFTDETGKVLRADYFPVRLDRKVPKSAGYAIDSHRQSRSPPSPAQRQQHRNRVHASSIVKKTPPTFMMVDYNEESRRLLPSRFANAPPNHSSGLNLLTTDSRSEGFERNPSRTITPKLNRMPSKPKFLPQALRTSFVLKQKIAVEADVSAQLFNRHDAETQTLKNLERLDLAGVRDYQVWNNEVSEPFLKDLRKAIKTNRPACLEDYIIAYCEAKKSQRPIPETVYELNKPSSNAASVVNQHPEEL